MEGLLLAEALRELAPHLPGRRGAWRFPDPYTFVLPLERGALWLFNRPPHPRLAWRREVPPAGGPHTPFQELLAARAAGELVAAAQDRLDRVVRLEFGPTEGFVALPAVTLVAELTGRNCNLALLDTEGRVIGAAREIGPEINRYRQLLPGRIYQPPPPYEKLDPCRASDAELVGALLGTKPARIGSVLDGFGPELSRAFALTAGAPPREPLSAERLPAALSAVRRLCAEPSAVLGETAGHRDLAQLRRAEERAQRLGLVENATNKELALVRRQLEDLERARAAAAEAPGLREQADLLLARQAEVPSGVERVTLEGFTGERVEIRLDPARDAVGNAQALYERARKREAKARNADAREEELRAREELLAGRAAALETLSDERLAALAEELAPRPAKEGRRLPGIRMTGPHGLTVLVGRNARENDQITFRVAKSRDVWLHAQGYRGSHVVILAENREVPFDAVLFAAQLAAAHSEAGSSDGVPVDYTLRKNVWKVKGGPPGAVRYTQQKTVYVTPNRRPDAG